MRGKRGCARHQRPPGWYMEECRLVTGDVRRKRGPRSWSKGALADSRGWASGTRPIFLVVIISRTLQAVRSIALEVSVDAIMFGNHGYRLELYGYLNSGR